MNQSSGFRRVVRDIADLCELQLELLAVDGRVATRQGFKAGLLLVVAAVFALSAVTVCLLAMASALHEQLGWTLSGSLLVASISAACVGAFLALIGLVVVRKAFNAMEETRSEFAENLRWIKAAVISPETSPRAQVNENSFTDPFASARATYSR